MSLLLSLNLNKSMNKLFNRLEILPNWFYLITCSYIQILVDVQLFNHRQTFVMWSLDLYVVYHWDF